MSSLSEIETTSRRPNNNGQQGQQLPNDEQQNRYGLEGLPQEYYLRRSLSDRHDYHNENRGENIEDTNMRRNVYTEVAENAVEALQRKKTDETIMIHVDNSVINADCCKCPIF